MRFSNHAVRAIVRLATLCSFVLLIRKSASASGWDPCTPYLFGNVGSSQVFVNVWLRDTAPTQLGIAQATLEQMILDANAIWNEQGGVGITLRWAGTTTSDNTLGIVVVANNVACSSTLMATTVDLDTANPTSNRSGKIEIRKILALPLASPSHGLSMPRLIHHQASWT
jgi:hypothetical protein